MYLPGSPFGVAPWASVSSSVKMTHYVCEAAWIVQVPSTLASFILNEPKEEVKSMNRGLLTHALESHIGALTPGY